MPEKKERESSIVKDVVRDFIPGLSKIIKVLERSSPEFKERIAATDAKIKHRLDHGWTSRPKVKYSISAREIVPRRELGREPGRETRKVKPEITERESIVDVFENKEYNMVVAELPGVKDVEDVKVKLAGENLNLIAGEYRKKVKLPSPGKRIVAKTYKNQVLELKIERSEHHAN